MGSFVILAMFGFGWLVPYILHGEGGLFPVNENYWRSEFYAAREEDHKHVRPRAASWLRFLALLPPLSAILSIYLTSLSLVSDCNQLSAFALLPISHDGSLTLFRWHLNHLNNRRRKNITRVRNCPDITILNTLFDQSSHGSFDGQDGLGGQDGQGGLNLKLLSLYSHSLCPNSKVAVSDWFSEER